MHDAHKRNNYDLCIIGGAGHVGLPLGVTFALHGVKTVLLDINQVALQKIERGLFPFKEENGTKKLKQALGKGSLFTTTSPRVIADSRFVILVIGTPIDKYLNPDSRGIFSVMDKYFEFFYDGQILILRSTVYPGTSEKIQRYFKAKKKNVHVAFCPERIIEGKAFDEFANLPQIVSAFDTTTLTTIKRLFGKLTNRKIISIKPVEAELSKLFSNAWRYITFSVANQFFMMATDYGLDYHRIYNAMTEDYERMKDLPSPGFAAGPCLFKDTMQLSAFSDHTFHLGHTAMLINEGLPNYIMQMLVKDYSDIHNKTIGILGMAFKAESDDQRDSLSFKLRKIAETKCHKVLCHDFYIKSSEFSSLPDVLRKSDIIILATPHKKYKDINLRRYKDKRFIDIWKFWQD